MTDNRYPMALYPPKSEMLIVNDEQEHAAALVAHWEVQDEPAAEPDSAETVVDDGSDVLDDAGKRGPGRPRRVIP